MRRMMIALLALLSVLSLPSPSAALPPGPAYDRLFLLSTPDSELYWTPDASDPELGALSVRRGCPTPNICSWVATSSYMHETYFSAAAVREGVVAWGPGEPLRFHIEATLTGPTTPSIHGVVDAGTQRFETPAATQTSPGVWEMELSQAGQILAGTPMWFGVRLRYPGQPAGHSIEFETAGASYVDLPAPVRMRTVPQLLEEDVYRKSPSMLVTADRSFRFNDRDWEVRSFDGDLSAEKGVTLALDRPAVAVVGWMDGFAEPFAYGAARGDAAARKPTETGFVDLFTDEAPIASNRYSAVAIDVPPGALRMTVRGQPNAGPYPYRAHLLVVYGARTLAAMRWRFEIPTPYARTFYTGACAVPSQQIPVPSEVTTYRVAVSADSSVPTPRAWTLGYTAPGFAGNECGLPEQGMAMRFLFPGPRVDKVVPNPKRHATFASAWDTRFEGEAVWSYTPPCPESGPPLCEEG